MICKKDVIQWFKELESYKRIDTMCSLLLACLPFELRFLGTCLEELGRRDSQDLRGMELRVNNPQDLSTDMVACQKGEPTDIKIRRRMALYLALLRVCNRTCVAEIFKTLESWSERDFSLMNDPDTLQELLLVYTMAANHPVFSFEQHMKCTAVLERIKENKIIKCQEQRRTEKCNVTCLPSSLEAIDSNCQISSPQSEFLPTQSYYALHSSDQHSQLIHLVPQNTMQLNFAQNVQKVISHEGTVQHQIGIDEPLQTLSPNVSIPVDSNHIVSHSNAGWHSRSYQSGGVEHTPKSSSPMLSQQSSPSSSRATSPKRCSAYFIQQQQSTHQMRNLSQRGLKSVRRPSSDNTPPLNSQNPQIIQNEVISPSNMQHPEEPLVHCEGTNNNLQSFIRNGYSRNLQNQKVKSTAYSSYSHPQQQSTGVQHFQPLSSGNYSTNTVGITYALQNIAISDISGQQNMDHAVSNISSNKSTGSDSGSSVGSSGETSPPDTPTLLTANCIRLNNESVQPQRLFYCKQINSIRKNGRKESQSNNSCNLNSLAGSSAFSQGLQYNQSFSNEIMLPPSGSASGNLLQSVITKNSSNNGGININTCIVTTSNNNLSNITSLISSTNTISGTSNISPGNVATTNSGQSLMQSHQPQYHTNFNYQSGCQHGSAPIANSGRLPQLLTPTNAILPPTPGSFRLPSAFQLSNNGDTIIYPAYHPGGLAFLSSSPAPPSTAQLSVMNSSSSSMNSTHSASLQLPIPQPPLLSLQNQHQNAPLPPTSILTAASSFTSLTAISSFNKPLSCYNCGSQAHNGRECQEVSMEDTTRNAIYKLDFSVSATPSISSPTSAISKVNVSSTSGKQSPHSNETPPQSSTAALKGTSILPATVVSIVAPASTPKAGLHN